MVRPFPLPVWTIPITDVAVVTWQWLEGHNSDCAYTASWSVINWRHVRHLHPPRKDDKTTQDMEQDDNGYLPPL